MKKLILISLIILFYISLVNIKADITIKAEVDKDVVTLDDTIVYTLTISGDKTNLPEPELPDFEGFEIVSGPNVSTSFSIVNMQVSAEKTIQYVLMPTKEGNLTIKPAKIKIGFKTYKSNEVKIKVISSGIQKPTSTPSTSIQKKENLPPVRNKNLFILAKVDKKEAYVGEQITLTYEIYYRVNLNNLSFRNTVSPTGFWVEDLKSPSRLQPRITYIKNKRYYKALLKRLALFPTSAGKYKIPPLEVECQVIVPRRSPFRDPFFDDFFSSSFFGDYKNIPVRSNTIEINVLPLPEKNKPKNFSGAVGKYKISANIDKSQIRAKENIKLHITLQGIGNIKLAKDITLPKLENVKIYEPTKRENVGIQNLRIIGEREYEYILMPLKEGTLKLPPIEFSYFDPELNQYKIAKTPQFKINVLPSMEEEKKNIFIVKKGNQVIKIERKDIRYLKTELKNIKTKYTPLYGKLWVQLTFSSPIIFSIILFGYYQRKKKLLENPSYLRKIKAYKNALEILELAKDSIKKNDIKNGYKYVHSAISSYIADKIDVPKTTITPFYLEDLIKKHNLDKNLIAKAVDILKQCEEVIYSPITPDNSQILENLIKQTSNLINKFEKNKVFKNFKNEKN